MFFVSASAGGVSAAHFGGLRLLRLFFRMPMRGEPGRPEFKARRFHTPVENAIYLLGTSATRPQNRAESETWGLCELEAQSSPTSPSLQSPANVAAPRAGGRMPVLDAQIGGPLRRSQARSAGPGWPHAAAKGTAPSGPPPNGGGRGALRTPPPGSRTRISMILVSADFEGPGPGARATLPRCGGQCFPPF